MRMIDAVGDIAYVAGSNKDIVATGPIPGNTPISVPTKTPTKHASRFAGVRGTVLRQALGTNPAAILGTWIGTETTASASVFQSANVPVMTDSYLISGVDNIPYYFSISPTGDGIGAGGKIRKHRHQQNHGRPSDDHPTPIAFAAGRDTCVPQAEPSPNMLWAFL